MSGTTSVVHQLHLAPPRLLVAALAVLTVACNEPKPTRRAAAASAPVAAQGAGSEAEQLGQHIFQLADRVDSYRASHRGRLPRSLRALGQDSIVGPIVRRLSTAGNGSITAAYRRPQEHEVRWCRGDLKVLEEAALRGDEFEITCAGVDGEKATTVRRFPGP